MKTKKAVGEPDKSKPYEINEYKDGRFLCSFWDDMGSRALLLFTREQLGALGAHIREAGFV